MELLPYILSGKIYLYFSMRWKWPAQGTSTVPIVSAHFRSPCCRSNVDRRKWCQLRSADNGHQYHAVRPLSWHHAATCNDGRASGEITQSEMWDKVPEETSLVLEHPTFSNAAHM